MWNVVCEQALTKGGSTNLDQIRDVYLPRVRRLNVGPGRGLGVERMRLLIAFSAD